MATSRQLFHKSIYKIEFETLQDLLDDEDLTYEGRSPVVVGSVVYIRDTGFRYTIAEREAVDHDITNNNVIPVKLKVTPLPEGCVTCSQFGVTGTADDDTVFGRFITYLNANPDVPGVLGKGTTTFSTTKSLTSQGIVIIGAFNQSPRTGSTKKLSTLEWVGGTDPMFDTDKSTLKFVGFGVEGNNSATDFLEMNSGSQRIIMEDVYFDANQFTRSVIRSNGNRVGYSQFFRVQATDSAPKFIDLDGQGTSNGCTPVAFKECRFTNSGSGGGSPWTIFHIKDETVERVIFEDCLFISRDGVIVVDTTDTPLSTAINVLDVHNCEIDNVEGSTFRMFKCENVQNILFDGNIVSGDGSPTYLFECDSSRVSSCVGNTMRSISYIFDLDDDCLISGVGMNNTDWSTVQGIHDNHNATFSSLTYGSTITIDGSDFAPNEVGQAIVDVTDANAYDFQVDTTKPQNMEPGQLFDITIRNASGGAIATGTFNSSTFSAGTQTAPANNTQRTYNFRWNGTKALEIGRTTADITY